MKIQNFKCHLIRNEICEFRFLQDAKFQSQGDITIHCAQTEAQKFAIEEIASSKTLSVNQHSNIDRSIE